MTDNLPAKTAPKGIDIADLIHYRQVKKLSCSEIGKIVGCSEQNVQQRLAEAELETVGNFNTSKDHVLEHLQYRTLKNIGDAELKGLNPLQRITAAAILQDKIAALRGQASTIIDHRHLVVDLSKAIEAMRAEGNVIDVTPVDRSSYQPVCPVSDAD